MRGSGCLIQDQRGMTLIEIMVVIMIIAGLMTVLGSTAFGQYQKAKVQQAVIQMGNIQSALKNYALDCGDFPSEEAGLSALVVSPGSETCANWGPDPYLKKNQLRDTFNHVFVYHYDGVGEPEIIFLGKDGRPGGSGFDKDVSTIDSATSAQVGAAL